MVKFRLYPLYLFLCIFFVDFFSKYLVQHHLPLRKYHAMWYPYGGIGVFKNFWGVEFSIIHEINKGAAWGIFHDFQIPLLILRICLILGMTAYLLFYNKRSQWVLPLVLVTAGAA